MPDYNKGDFTQQGVAGHVNTILRLNEKRYVYIDLTSNEEAEGCTISGAVADPLNNEVYPIGAGVSGNIEITENGENINVAPYATATVNVSGGLDLLYCDVIIHNSETSSQALSCDDVSITFGGNTIENNAITLWNGDSPTDSIAIGESITYRLYYNNTPVPMLPAILVEYPESSTEVTVDTATNLTLTTEHSLNSYAPTDATKNSLLELTIYQGTGR